MEFIISNLLVQNSVKISEEKERNVVHWIECEMCSQVKCELRKFN